MVCNLPDPYISSVTGSQASFLYWPFHQNTIVTAKVESYLEKLLEKFSFPWNTRKGEVHPGLLPIDWCRIFKAHLNRIKFLVLYCAAGTVASEARWQVGEHSSWRTHIVCHNNEGIITNI